MAENDKEIIIDKGEMAKRLKEARIRLIISNPFFGNLILHLNFAVADCGTAATDMKRVYFDPAFMRRLSDEELDFVLKHEIMHCALSHCVRGKGKNRLLFNIATDIVANSNILNSMGKTDFLVDNEKVMHLCPDGKEGYLYSAEEVYEQLLNKKKNKDKGVYTISADGENEDQSGPDNHDIWQTIEQDSSLIDEWKKRVVESGRNMGTDNDLPPGIRALIEDYENEGKVDWKTVLHDFIRKVFDKNDYTFQPPDRRFQFNDIFLPSFNEIYGEKVDNIWFVVDTSGSISTETLSLIISEIKSAISQFDSLLGKLSFFDSNVSDPKEFDSIDTLNSITPVGGGGTSFINIFRYLNEKMSDNLPEAIIILTDGYAEYPSDKMALDIPVMWILVDNEEDAPWGISIHINNT